MPKQKEITDFFDRGTKSYSLNFYEHPRWRTYRNLIVRLILHLPPSPSILDVGCGPHPSLPALFDRASLYVCLDGSFENLKRLSRGNQKLKAIQAVLNQGASLPVTGAYDLVITFGLLQYLNDPQALVEELTPLVKPGGYLLSHDPSDYWTSRMLPVHGRGFSKDELLNFFKPRFEIVWLKSFHYLGLEKKVNWILSRNRIHVSIAIILWRIIFEIEELFNQLKIYGGTDWLILARRPLN